MVRVEPEVLQQLGVVHAADVIAAFEADGLQAFVQTGLDTNKARIARSDHCHTPNHRQALRKQDCSSGEPCPKHAEGHLFFTGVHIYSLHRRTPPSSATRGQCRPVCVILPAPLLGACFQARVLVLHRQQGAGNGCWGLGGQKQSPLAGVYLQL
ncbi:hypothetical protein EYF80_038890 [Liparis tanakae]|uniref:Uncharacterized protein n=1 Tax=Liparis tanakae TaxID=230148 RepID=A0A4Z2GC11_9TELE|nr:hypothetical protein EYF80_038890 [Liparis tanakae]